MRTAFALSVVGFLTSAALAGECVCTSAKIENGWCGDCSHGYVDAVKISSKKLFESLDGRKIEKDEIQCAGCKAAAAKGGVCTECKVGFADGHAYPSMVAYRLASGKAKDAEKIKCESCKAAAADHGWCDDCKRGMVGPRVFKEKEAYEGAVKARTILVSAAEAAGKCEACAVAMVTDGKCEACKVAYKDGKKIETP